MWNYGPLLQCINHLQLPVVNSLPQDHLWILAPMHVQSHTSLGWENWRPIFSQLIQILPLLSVLTSGNSPAQLSQNTYRAWNVYRSSGINCFLVLLIDTNAEVLKLQHLPESPEGRVKTRCWAPPQECLIQ